VKTKRSRHNAVLQPFIHGYATTVVFKTLACTFTCWKDRWWVKKLQDLLKFVFVCFVVGLSSD